MTATREGLAAMHRANPAAAAHHTHAIGSEGDGLRVSAPRPHGRVVVVRPRLRHDGIGRRWLLLLLPSRAARNTAAHALIASRRLIAVPAERRARQIRRLRAPSSRCRRSGHLCTCRSRHAVVVGPRLRPGPWNTAQRNNGHHKADSAQVSHGIGPIIPASRPAIALPALFRGQSNYRIFQPNRNETVLSEPFFRGRPRATDNLEAS